MNDQYIQQGEIMTEPESRPSQQILTAGGGLKASGDVTPTPDTQSQLPSTDKENLLEKMQSDFPIEEQHKLDDVPPSDIFDFFKKQYSNEQPTQQQPQNNQPEQTVTPEQPKPEAEPVPEPTNEPKLEQSTPVWEAEKQQYISEIEGLKAQLTFEKELKENPLETLSKYVPGVVLNEKSPYFFDPKKYVEQQIKEKYGDNFVFDPKDAYIPNTVSYDYRVDVENWGNQAKNTVSKAQETQQSIIAKQTQEFEQSKTAVKTKYGMDDVTFQNLIMDNLEKMADSDRLMLLADAIMIVKGNLKASENMKATNSLKTRPPSPTDLKVSSKKTVTNNPTMEAFIKEFGTPTRNMSTY